jgi:hypothetical protein
VTASGRLLATRMPAIRRLPFGTIAFHPASDPAARYAPLALVGCRQREAAAAGLLSTFLIKLLAIPMSVAGLGRVPVNTCNVISAAKE